MHPQGKCLLQNKAFFPIPHADGKILALSELEAFIDDGSRVTQMMEFLLTLSQTTNFRLFQIERVCRLQFLI